MTLNPKLALKSVASIKTFGAVYKVDTNHAWLLPIDENNRRCKAAGYSGLKDYFIKRGLKLTKWKDTGLIKELVATNGELMTFDREFPFCKIDNIKPAFKETVLLRTSTSSTKKPDTELVPKGIRSLSPALKHTVKHVEAVAEETDNKTETSQTSINVYYQMRRSKTLSMLKCDKENNALTQERSHRPSNTGHALPLVLGRSLTCLPKVSFSKCSEVNTSDSVHSASTVKQNVLRESMSYRKFDRKNNSPTAKTSPKLEMRVTRKKCDNINKASRDNLSKPSNNNRSETQYNSLKVNITNTFVDIPLVELEGNTDSSTTSTSLSMFSASSSIESFTDKKESVIRIDITSSGRESRSKNSAENVGTRLLCTYVAGGFADKDKGIHYKSFSKICNDQTSEKQEQNSKKNDTKRELKMLNLQTTEPAVEIPEYSEQTLNSKARSVEASPEEQFCSESAKLPQESTQNNNNKDYFESVMPTKESCFKTDENYLTKACEKLKEVGAVEIMYPKSTGIMQKQEIAQPSSEHLSPETSVTLGCSDDNYSSLIDMRCTLNDMEYSLENMKRTLQHCRRISEKEADTQYRVSEMPDVEFRDNSDLHKDNDITKPTILEHSDAETNYNWSDSKQKQHDVDQVEATSYSTAVIKVNDRQVARVDETFRPVLLLDMNQRRAVEKVNSLHRAPRLKINFPERLFLKIEGYDSYPYIIRKLAENPLFTQILYKRLSSAVTPNLCYRLQQSTDTKGILLPDQHEIHRTTEQSCKRTLLKNGILYKDAETQTQFFDETDDHEYKIVLYDSPEKLDMKAGISYKDALTEILAEDFLTDNECGCKISGEGEPKNNPETQNFQVDVYDRGEDSDEFSVYEDALD